MAAEFEKDSLLDAAALVFQTPVRAKKGRPPYHSHTHNVHRALQLAGVMGQVTRVTRRKPEVMVKVTGSARGFRSLKEHLAYITRNGKIVGERENGERIEGASDVRDLAEEWWADGVDRRKGTRDTINLILSMPPGTDERTVAEAARAFARKTFGDHYDYLLAHHNQESDPKRPENPHAHLTIKTRGRRGQSLNPRKADLQAWREGFAAELRARDVEAEATPRRARGVTRKGQRQTIRHMDKRRASRVTQWKLMQAIKTVAAGKDKPEETPWIKAAQERQRKVRRAWNTLAMAFEDAGQSALAQEIRHFVTAMTPALTEREHHIAQAKKLLHKQLVDKQQVRDRGRSR